LSQKPRIFKKTAGKAGHNEFVSGARRTIPSGSGEFSPPERV